METIDDDLMRGGDRCRRRFRRRGGGPSSSSPRCAYIVSPATGVLCVWILDDDNDYRVRMRTAARGRVDARPTREYDASVVRATKAQGRRGPDRPHPPRLERRRRWTPTTDRVVWPLADSVDLPLSTVEGPHDVPSDDAPRQDRRGPDDRRGRPHRPRQGRQHRKGPLQLPHDALQVKERSGGVRDMTTTTTAARRMTTSWRWYRSRRRRRMQELRDEASTAAATTQQKKEQMKC